MTATEEAIYILHPILVPVYENGEIIPEANLEKIEKSTVRWRRNNHSRTFKTEELEMPSLIKLPKPIQSLLENPNIFLELPPNEINRISNAFEEIIPEYERCDEEEYQASQQFYFQEGIYLAGCNFHHAVRKADFDKCFIFYEKCFRDSYWLKNEGNSQKVTLTAPARVTTLEKLAMAG